MSSLEIPSATKPSLGQDWLDALRYWLRGRRGVAALMLSALVLGAALNWSWLVAVGIAPLLLKVLPCVAMCGLGLCMNRMTGGSCSSSASTKDHAGVPKPNTGQRIAAPEPVEGVPVSLTSEAGLVPGHPTVGTAEPAPNQQPQVQEERE